MWCNTPFFQDLETLRSSKASRTAQHMMEKVYDSFFSLKCPPCGVLVGPPGEFLRHLKVCRSRTVRCDEEGCEEEYRLEDAHTHKTNSCIPRPCPFACDPSLSMMPGLLHKTIQDCVNHLKEQNSHLREELQRKRPRCCMFFFHTRGGSLPRHDHLPQPHNGCLSSQQMVVPSSPESWGTRLKSGTFVLPHPPLYQKPEKIEGGLRGIPPLTPHHRLIKS
jgi:hypothetical protein